MEEGVKTALQILAAAVTIIIGIFTVYRNRAKLRKMIRDFAIRALEIKTGDYKSTLERVQNTKTLRIGCIIADPWFIKEKDDVVGGIYRVIFDDIANRNSLKPHYIPIRNDTVYDMLNKGELDLVAQLLQTAERANNATFAACIHNVSMVAVVRKDQTKITCTADLKKNEVRCAVVRGEIGSQIAPELFNMTEENNRLITLSTPDVPSVFHLVNGEVDVTITTMARWLEHQTRHPEATNLLRPVADEALMKVPAGCLIKKSENEFKVWLEKETAITRGKSDIAQKEKSHIAPFASAIEIL